MLYFWLFPHPWFYMYMDIWKIKEWMNEMEWNKHTDIQTQTQTRCLFKVFSFIWLWLSKNSCTAWNVDSLTILRCDPPGLLMAYMWQPRVLSRRCSFKSCRPIAELSVFKSPSKSDSRNTWILLSRPEIIIWIDIWASQQYYEGFDFWHSPLSQCCCVSPDCRLIIFQILRVVTK
jgi:hypothetical protein